MKELFHFAKSLHSHTGSVLYLNLLGMVAVGFLEGIGILLIIPMLSLIGVLDTNGTIFSWVSGFFPEEALNLPIVLGLFLFIIIATGLFQRQQSIWNAKIKQGFVLNLRLQTYRDLIQANWGFFLKKRKSELSNLMTTELARVSSGTNLFLQLIASVIFTLIQLAIAFWLSFEMTAFVLCSCAILALFSRRLVKKANLLGKRTTQYAHEYMGQLTDDLNGIKDIKSNQLEEKQFNRFRDLCRRLEKNTIHFAVLSANSTFLYRISAGAVIAAFVFLSVQVLKLPSASILLIIVIFARLWPQLAKIQSSLENMGSLLPAFQSIIELQKECAEAKQSFLLSKGNPIQLTRSIEFRHVDFRYNPAIKEYTLRDINVTIPANKMTAIAGQSGAGKSTFIDLLMGLNQPEKGEIRVDEEVMTEEMMSRLKPSISYVPQDPFLFNDTIRNNLLLIKPNAGEEELWDSLRAASADFVRALPDGLDTRLGDRGVRLSGGERQRIVLARALLRKPSLLILDEATSAIDTENEKIILESLHRLKEQVTIVVIAHRLSAIQAADQVIVIEKGNIQTANTKANENIHALFTAKNQ